MLIRLKTGYLVYFAVKFVVHSKGRMIIKYKFWNKASLTVLKRGKK